MLVIEELSENRDQMGSKAVDIDKLKIQDAKYRRIKVDSGENQDITVPLEEAILINDTEVRRKLMLDILHRNPEDYIELLQRARLANDVEITHYATTTMMEIQSNYELRLQKLSQEAKRQPENIAVLEQYRAELVKYIDSGLITGNILTIYRNQLEDVLYKLMTLCPSNKTYLYGWIDNKVAMKSYDGVLEKLNEAKEQWPEDEMVYQLFVKYHFSTGRGDLIKAVLEEVKSKQIYLTHEGKNWLRFWRQEEA